MAHAPAAEKVECHRSVNWNVIAVSQGVSLLPVTLKELSLCLTLEKLTLCLSPLRS